MGLAMFLLIHAIIYTLMRLANYMFVPVHEVLHVSLALAIIIALTIDGFRCRGERTPFSSIVNAILPMIALFFVVLIMIAYESYLYGILAIVTLICSLILFFACRQKRIVKVIFGIVYVLVLVVYPMFLVLWLSMLGTSPPGTTQVRQTELSPNGIHSVEVIDYNSLGRVTTWIEVTPQDRDVNLLVGVLRPNPQRIYTVHWNDTTPMTLHWETDEILHITYEARQTITTRFEWQGNAWVQR